MKTFLTVSAIALGFAMAVNTEHVQAQGNYTLQQAFKVTYVAPGGPAARQGMEAEDMILSVNGNVVRSGQDLQFYLGQAGGVARLEVKDWRTDRINQMTVYPIGGRICINGCTAPLALNNETISPPPPAPYNGGLSNSVINPNPYNSGYGSVGGGAIPSYPNRPIGR